MNIELLKKLCETPGVPGREERVRELILKEVKGLFDEIEVDPLGSLICLRDPRPGKGGSKKTAKKTTKKAAPAPEDEPLRVMLLCHMDEIGFYVSSIDESGYLFVNPAGGFDPRNLFSRRVRVIGKSQEFPGVMNPGGRPVHISSPEDRKKVPEVKEFYVDTGMTKEDVDKHVRIGDPIVMDEPLIEMGDKVVSKALDNRVACWLGIESIRKLHKAGTAHDCEIVVAFTTQEEVGLRGAKTASYTVQPDIGIGIDVTLACDTPGVPAAERVTTQGEGVALHIKDASFISDHELVDQIEAIAKRKKIKHQRSILAAGGQDGAAAQQAAAGARAIGLTVGTRYIHTVTEMIDKRDLAAARDLIAAYLSEA
ncbi:MAG: M20/M25/M40 family metallo-hydrolase [Planctomycetota bacterium]